MRFVMNGKVNTRYVGPYRFLKRKGNVAYGLELPAELEVVHPLIYISYMKKFVADPATIVPLESVTVKNSLSYEDVLVDILQCKVRRMSNKEVASVKFCIGISP